MEPSEILEVLLDLARDTGVEVRSVPRTGLAAGELPPGSGVVRVKGDVWVMLSEADPVALQLGVLAGALRDHAADALEDRYLPPAVRALLEEH